MKQITNKEYEEWQRYKEEKANLIEDILEKDSQESYFIQICDFISYFVHLYYRSIIQKAPLPNRVARVIDTTFVSRVLATLKDGNLLNLDAAHNHPYGLVIYPHG